jgi:hypothetical protein
MLQNPLPSLLVLSSLFVNYVWKKRVNENEIRLAMESQLLEEKYSFLEGNLDQ